MKSDPTLIDGATQLLERARELSRHLDWSDDAYDVRKAHVCSLLSHLAYHHIPAATPGPGYGWLSRLRRWLPRFRVIDSATFDEALARNARADLRELVVQGDRVSGIVDVLEVRGARAVTTRLDDVIIVAIRGSTVFSRYAPGDWWANIRCWQQPLPDDKTVSLHVGFLRTAVTMRKALNESLDRLDVALRPIYMTGHSLGGAVAAILNGTWAHDSGSPRNPGRTLTSSGCYTFGMPRYGDTGAMQRKQPFHARQVRDPVPYLPPRWGPCWRYADCSPINVRRMSRWRGNPHGIEQYATAIESLARSS